MQMHKQIQVKSFQGQDRSIEQVPNASMVAIQIKKEVQVDEILIFPPLPLLKNNNVISS